MNRSSYNFKIITPQDRLPNDPVFWCILDKKRRVFLWKDGSIHQRAVGFKTPYTDMMEAYKNAPGYWDSKTEAEQFLSDWLNSQ